MMSRRPMVWRPMFWCLLGIRSSLVAGLLGLGCVSAAAQEFASLNPMKAIAGGDLKGFLERPLFDPSRRLPPPAPPPVVVEAPPVAAPEPPPTLHLLGVIQGRRDMAVVQRDGESKTIILRSGDLVGGWKVTVLPSGGIRIGDGSRTVDYAMFTKNSGLASVAVNTGPDNMTEMSAALAARNARLSKRTY